MKLKQLLLLGLLLSLTSATFTYSQAPDPVKADTTSAIMELAPKIFVDYDHLDMDHIRREVNFVNYVRDRRLADIYVLVTRIRNANGGREFTLTFTGKNDFAGMKDTLVFNTTNYDTKDQFREKFVKTLKLGLIPFILKTPLAESLKIGFDYNGSMQDIKDKWDYWVFRIRLNGSLSGEQFRDYYKIGANLNADRITDEWKLRLDIEFDYDEENYHLEDDTSWTSDSKRLRIDAGLVKSISSHWSLGLQSRLLSSTYKNIKMGYELTPAIEYDIYPYDESTYREIRIVYFIGPRYRFYNEKTIYEKTEEFLMHHGVQVDVEIKQPWGQIDLRGEYNNYLYDWSKRRFNVWGRISLNLFEGFALDFGGGYSKIHDQLALPIRDLDIEEILLRRAELATQYSFNFSFGISYTFGAIYNNIVNPRLGG